ncbi:MAG: chromate transporter [Peptococcales bacterium]|jgi:chromate transporter
MKFLWEIFITFFKIGAFTFGGGYAMLPLIEHEVVTNKKWVSEEDIVDVLAISQSVPGAIAINSSTFIGYKIAGLRGAFAATLGTILPSFLIILVLAGFLITYSDNVLINKVFYGIRAVVVALILSAVFKLGKKSITDMRTLIIATIAFLLLIIFDFHPIFAIIGGGFVGIILHSKILLSQEREGDN